MEGQAKRYCNIKYTLSLIETGYIILILLFFVGLGGSGALAGLVTGLSPHPALIIPAYLLAVYILYYLLNFPLAIYHSFILEHQFNLSRENFGGWLFDQLKAGAITYIILLIFFDAFYFVLAAAPGSWWLVISLFWIFFNLILSRLAPIVIIPLFFKYKLLSDETLRRRIINLAEKMRIKILDVFEIDLSRKTLKANAAFVGLGKTRRVILADTLKDKYTHDEIEVILAHEFAHYKLKHLIKLILINSAATIIVFYFIFKTSAGLLRIFNLSSLSDIAALPVTWLYFVLFGVAAQPWQNFLSRLMETNADKMALQITAKPQAFISMMEKLGEQNLADVSPHPVIKFFFFDHPPISERINLARLKS